MTLIENPLVDEVQKRASLIGAVALGLQVTFLAFFDNQRFKIFSGHPCRHINPDHGQRGRLDRKEKAFHLPPLRLHCLQRQLLVQLVPHGLLLVSLNQAFLFLW